MSKKRTENFVYFLVLLFFISIMVIGYQWNQKHGGLYKEAYRPAVEEHVRVRQSKAPETTAEPRPPGLREDQIKKQRGNRFATF